MDYLIKETQVYTTGKDGQPYVSQKTSKPYARLKVKLDKQEEKDITLFAWDLNNIPKVGDTIKGEIKEQPEYNGKKQYIFEFLKKENPNSKALEDLLVKMTLMSLKLDELVAWKRKETGEDKPKIAGTDIPYPTQESEGIDENNIPFS